MKHILKNSNGSALLIAVAVLLIFSILGLSLLTLTTNGLAKNETRENIVQATDLADKGVEFSVKELQKKIEDKIKNDKMGKIQFGNFLDSILYDTQLSCSISDKYGYKITGENKSETKVCIENVENIKRNRVTGEIVTYDDSEDIKKNSVTEERDSYKRIVTFKSTGIVDGKEHTTRSQVILGTDAIPDQLRYALSSNNEGSIYLYGGVDVKGDIKTSKDLIIHNQGYILSGSTTNWIASVYPRMKADSKSVTPKIILPDEGNVFVNINTGHLKNENSVLNLNVYNNLNRYKKFQVNELLTNNQLRNILFDSNNVNIVKKVLNPDELKIEEKIDLTYSSKIYKNDDINSINVTSYSSKNIVNNSKDDIILVSNTTKVRGECKKKKGNYCEEYYYNTLLSKGSFNINGINNLNLVGQYHINGDFSISNSSVNSDAILYVNGDVDIENSTLSGYTSNGTLIIFATGKIRIINTSKYENTPSKIKAFFYSHDTVNIFGAISNIEITGGISGKNIILSALRGKYTSSGSTDGSSLQSELYDHDNNPSTPNIPKKNSRFKIIYDQDLIESYTSFKRDEEEEFITEVNPPEVLNRY